MELPCAVYSILTIRAFWKFLEEKEFGNFLQQELAIITGAVEVFITDVQCVMPALGKIAGCFHTKVVSTSPKAKFPGVEHIEFSEEEALPIAKKIVKIVVVTGNKKLSPPCGICRQVMREFNPKLEIVVANLQKEFKILTLQDLLPYSFGPDSFRLGQD